MATEQTCIPTSMEVFDCMNDISSERAFLDDTVTLLNDLLEFYNVGTDIPKSLQSDLSVIWRILNSINESLEKTENRLIDISRRLKNNE